MPADGGVGGLDRRGGHRRVERVGASLWTIAFALSTRMPMWAATLWLPSCWPALPAC